MNEPKKLYRLDKGAMLAGVCGGVAEYFNLDPNVVRLLWVLVSLCSAGVGVVLYIVGACLLPRKSDIYPGY